MHPLKVIHFYKVVSLKTSLAQKFVAINLIPFLLGSVVGYRKTSQMLLSIFRNCKVTVNVQIRRRIVINYMDNICLIKITI